jgi:hypothetical protein
LKFLKKMARPARASQVQWPKLPKTSKAQRVW